MSVLPEWVGFAPPPARGGLCGLCGFLRGRGGTAANNHRPVGLPYAPVPATSGGNSAAFRQPNKAERPGCFLPMWQTKCGCRFYPMKLPSSRSPLREAWQQAMVRQVFSEPNPTTSRPTIQRSMRFSNPPGLRIIPVPVWFPVNLPTPGGTRVTQGIPYMIAGRVLCYNVRVIKINKVYQRFAFRNGKIQKYLDIIPSIGHLPRPYRPKRVHFSPCRRCSHPTIRTVPTPLCYPWAQRFPRKLPVPWCAPSGTRTANSRMRPMSAPPPASPCWRLFIPEINWKPCWQPRVSRRTARSWTTSAAPPIPIRLRCWRSNFAPTRCR